MSDDRTEGHPARPEQTEHGFEEGFDRKPDPPEEDDVGRFSTGGERTPEHEPDKEDVGRFSEGAEQTGETPEKRREGSFGDTEERPPDRT